MNVTSLSGLSSLTALQSASTAQASPATQSRETEQSKGAGPPPGAPPPGGPPPGGPPPGAAPGGSGAASTEDETETLYQSLFEALSAQDSEESAAATVSVDRMKTNQFLSLLSEI